MLAYVQSIKKRDGGKSHLVYLLKALCISTLKGHARKWIETMTPGFKGYSSDVDMGSGLDTLRSGFRPEVCL